VLSFLHARCGSVGKGEGRDKRDRVRAKTRAKQHNAHNRARVVPPFLHAGCKWVGAAIVCVVSLLTRRRAGGGLGEGVRPEEGEAEAKGSGESQWRRHNAHNHSRRVVVEWGGWGLRLADSQS
jgi:hypothetical protein